MDIDIGLLDTQNTLKDKGILISFSGRFSQGIIVELGQAVQNYMKAEKIPKNEIYKTFAIFIELSQNIQNYSAVKENTDKDCKIANSGIANIGKTNGRYFVWAGNIIENSDAAPLKEKLDYLLTLDKPELKKLYKEQLKSDIQPESKGAGIGLIDIVRKAGEPPKYSIKQIDNDYSFYEIFVTI